MEEKLTQVLKEPQYASEIIKLIRSDIPTEKKLEFLEDYHENAIADAIIQLSPEERRALYKILDPEKLAEIFTYIEDDVEDYFKEMDIELFADVIEEMDADDAVDALEDVDQNTRQALAAQLDEETKADIRLIESYDEDEIGSAMTTNFIVISKNDTVKQAMRSMIAQAKENDNIATIYVVDEDDHFYGALDLTELITAREYTDLEPLMQTSYPYVNDHEKTADCIDRIIDYAEDSIPVLDAERHILGVITAHDLVEAVDEEFGDDYAKLAGLTSEEDLKEPLGKSLLKRMPWLIILLFLGMLVSSVVGVFEGVVASLSIVICFQSLILGMAGNVGTQSLGVTIRVLMDENLTSKQRWALVFKDLKVGTINGLILGSLSFVAVGLYIYFFKQYPLGFSFSVSACVGIALMLAMIISSVVGTVVPIFFNKINIDPAVASGPLITTINDLVAVVTYYGLVWVLLIGFLNITA